MRIAAALVVCAAWGMSPASERARNAPVEISAVRSDVIVAGRLESVGKPEKMRLCPPGSKEAAEGRYQTCRLIVRLVLKDAAAEPANKIRRGQRVTFLAPAAEADGKKKALSANTSYVLLLRRLAGREELYLPDVASCRHEDNPQAVARVRKATRTDQWRWGKAVGGLQVGLAPLPKGYRLVLEVHRRRGRTGVWKVKRVRPHVHIDPVVAIRNVSDKPVSFSLHPGDWTLTLACTGPKGKKVTREAEGGSGSRRPFDVKAVETLQPGQVRFLGADGLADESAPLAPELEDGSWTVRAVLSLQRPDAPGPDGTKRQLATGTVSSAPARFRVSTADPTRNMKIVPPRR